LKPLAQGARPEKCPLEKPVHIPQFGTIYLGEIDVFCSRVTLTMLRVELGSPHVGRIAAATNSTNGHDGY
jgi:hypothetical protein